LTASSADPNGGTVIYSLTVNPSNFFQIDPANGRVTVSDAGATGIDFESSGGAYTVTVEAADPSGMSNTANFTINVLDAPPSVPVDSDANANQVAEGAAAGTFVGVTAASTDPNGGTVTYSLSSDPGNFFQIDPSSGAVSVSAAGASGIDFESSGGAYTIAVEAADPSGLFNTANFTINVLDVAPSVPADSDTANANQVTEGAAAGTYVGLTASSTDPNGGAVTYSLSSDPGNFFQIDPMSGAVSVSAAGATGINFESSGGSYAITVEAADPSGAFNTADFTIGVVDVAPSASGFNATAAEAVQGGSPVTLLAAPPPTLGDVNSADLAGATVTISGFQTGDLLSANTAGTNISSSYAGGVLILSGNDTFAAYQDVLASVAYQDTGTDTTTVGHASRSFVWTVTDGTLNSMPPATTTLLVDRPPVTFADTNAATVGGPAVTGNVLGNDSDPDGDPITVTAISDTTNGASTVGGAALAGQFGALTIASNGAYTYTPDASISAPAGSHATDVFTYTASDGNSGSSTNTLTVTLDRPPAQTMHGVTVVEGTTIGPQSAGDSDPDGDSVTVTALSGGTVGSPLAGTYGTLTLNTNDTFSYTANNTAAVNAAPAGTDPTDTFSYTVSDGNGGTAIEMLAIAVTRPPTISGTVANQSTIAEAPVQPFSGVTMGDPDAAATDTLTITLSSNGTKLGTLSGTGLTGSGATYQLAGTAAAITAELDALTYTPVNGVPGTSVTTDFTLSDQSSVFATPTTDDTTSVIDTDLVNPSPPPGINLPHVTPSNVDEWILVDGEWAASAQPGSIPSGYQVAGTGDFTGNGTSDILWQNPTSGDTQEWLIDNGAWAGTVDLGVHPGNYQIAGIGDFFGNGIDDVLWTSPGTGPNGDTQVDIWQLGSNGQWIASVTPGLGLHPPGYYVVGVDDFTGNGTSDVLWQNPTNGDVDEWQIANGQWTQSVDLGSHPGSGWTISGIGDFFGNGIDDILWTNPGTGPNGDTQVDIWQLGSNGQWADSVTPGLGLHPAGYQVAAVGNFAGNGTDGVLWYDPSNGNVDEWVLANKGQWATSINLGSHPGNFQIAGTGAFVNGNNTSDILWHQNS
jgi:VCBS repeat-containing protein